LATRPALAVGWHAPPRNTPAYYAMGLINQMLIQGQDSMLHQALVQNAGLTGEVTGGINERGNMFEIEGPMMLTASLFHDADKSPDVILAAIDTEIAKLRSKPVDRATLD